MSSSSEDSSSSDDDASMHSAASPPSRDSSAKSMSGTQPDPLRAPSSPASSVVSSQPDFVAIDGGGFATLAEWKLTTLEDTVEDLRANEHEAPPADLTWPWVHDRAREWHEATLRRAVEREAERSGLIRSFPTEPPPSDAPPFEKICYGLLMQVKAGQQLDGDYVGQALGVDGDVRRGRRAFSRIPAFSSIPWWRTLRMAAQIYPGAIGMTYYDIGLEPGESDEDEDEEELQEIAADVAETARLKGVQSARDHLYERAMSRMACVLIVGWSRGWLCVHGKRWRRRQSE